jgi:hypothetical protein
MSSFVPNIEMINECIEASIQEGRLNRYEKIQNIINTLNKFQYTDKKSCLNKLFICEKLIWACMYNEDIERADKLIENLLIIGNECLETAEIKMKTENDYLNFSNLIMNRINQIKEALTVHKRCLKFEDQLMNAF